MSNPVISIHWNGSLFILTHINGDGTCSYKYSVDGSTWEDANVPENVLVVNYANNIKWIGDQLVIMGDLATSSGNVSLKSTDGIHYGLSRPDTTKQIVDMETNAEFRNTIRFPFSVLLAVGSGSDTNNTIAYSLNKGTTWSLSTSESSSVGVFSRVVNDARWNGRNWVAVGSGNTNTIATSVDGTSWMGRGMTVFSDEATSVDWAKETNLWVATGIDSSPNHYSTAYSVDGIYWIGQTITGITSGVSVRWNGEIWVFAGVSASGSNRSIAYSLDGKQWTSVPNTFSVKATRVEWNIGVGWTVFGEDPSWNVATSANGKEWRLHYDASINTLEHTLYDGTMFWKSNGGNTYSKSVDGEYWTTSSTITDISLSTVQRFVQNNTNEAIATIQPLSIATGEGHNTLAYSHDGLYWKGLGKNIFTERANRAVWNGTLWVAVGKGTYWVATSYDGIEWKGRESSIMTEGYDVAWNGLLFVAVGKGTNSTIATSTNGIDWNRIANSSDIFTDYASKVCWTGKTWLVYGSGTNTTAVSLDGINWTPTPDKNATIMDASSLFWNSGYMTGTTSPSGYTATSSTLQTGYEAYRLFDNIESTSWKSAENMYSNNGTYLGTEIITYSPLNGGPATLTASGEWVSLSIPSAKTIRYYSIMFDTTPENTPSAIPRQWILLGSNNGSTWSEIHSFMFQTDTPPNNTWKSARFILPINIYSNTTAYSQYRLVILGTFGASFATILHMDLYTENALSNTLSRYASPIVLKNNILYMNGLVNDSVSVYRLADLSCNTLESRPINGGQYVNTTINGIAGRTITSTCFDGEYTYITDISGAVAILTNESSNTHLNFDISLNGVLSIDSRLSSIYSSCWNRHFVLFAGNGGISYGKPDAGNRWNLTNASNLFDVVYGVASNSGYGFVYIPNALYFHPDELLKVVGPKSQPFTGETDIHFNLYNSNKR